MTCFRDEVDCKHFRDEFECQYFSEHFRDEVEIPNYRLEQRELQPNLALSSPAQPLEVCFALPEKELKDLTWRDGHGGGDCREALPEDKICDCKHVKIAQTL